MKRFRAYVMMILLAAGGMLCGEVKASAQERMWNAALDRYEYICRRCADWRERIDQGMPVPKDSLRILSNELSEVRKNLQYALGDMTPGQRRRFEAIRDWFTTGEWPEQVPGNITVEGDPLYSGLRPPLGTKEGTLSSRGIADAERISPQNSGTNPTTARIPVRVGGIAGVTAGVYPDLSYGVLAGITIGKWSLFVKGRSNFHTQKTSYICLSDGTIPVEDKPEGNSDNSSEGGYFWSGDAQRVNRHQVTLGASYAFCKPVSLYLGAGFGVRTLCWMDSDGDWARVRDRSYKNVALETGLLIHPIQKGPARGLTFLVGGSWIPRNYLDAEVGLLWRF